MRVLRFIVDGQIIKPDPNCDFSGLVPGATGYIEAVFSFSSEWNEFAKVATFWSRFGQEYPPQVIIASNVSFDMWCSIPSEALRKRSFKIQVLGKHNDTIIKTNKLTITLNGR